MGIANWRRRLRLGGATGRGAGDGPAGKLVDVRQLMGEMSVEECAARAEAHFAESADHEYHLCKPFTSVQEAAGLLQRYAQLAQGLGLLAGMTVLDFGAGSCWGSRWLTQLRMKVIALDVSASALEIGKELYARVPVVGVRPQPQFLVFDGRHIELPDESVDRVICFDALHHVPNPAEVLAELARVLREGGSAGFAEPGPRHSRSAQSQYEMRHHRVIENDIVIEEIWEQARGAGFTSMKLAVHNPQLLLLSPDEFSAFLSGGAPASRFVEETRAYMRGVRLFFLRKGETRERHDSRQAAGLEAELTVTSVATTVREGEPLRARVKATNRGEAVWLPLGAGIGVVRLGIHLFRADGEAVDINYSRHLLSPGEGRPIMPGETVDLEVEMPGLPGGQYVLEFDVVAEGVCWFEVNGSPVVRVPVTVQ